MPQVIVQLNQEENEDVKDVMQAKQLSKADAVMHLLTLGIAKHKRK